MNEEGERTTGPHCALRKQAVRLHLKGLPVMQIVGMTGLSWPGVRVALDRYEAGGMSAFETGNSWQKTGYGPRA